ncbi:MAG: Tad domain-containing protein [Rhodobacter sp.]|nr:Tad domain-containing protein [Rhodobacter sp.]
MAEKLPRSQSRERKASVAKHRAVISHNRSRNLQAFARKEDGSLIIFGLFMLVLMLLACGMGLDLMRLETARVQLQSTVDRAALAAANLNQELPPEQVVADYFEKAHLSEFLSGVQVDEDTGLRRVAVQTSLDMPMHFMSMAGVNTLPAPASGVAEESIGDVEISMVLDVSGSMNSYNRLTNLKGAAEDFVDTVYGLASHGIVSTSIVPYATQVSAGPDLLSQYNLGTETHDDSHCVNFDQSSFGSTALPTTVELQQTQHFDPWYNSQDLRLPVCRDEAGVDVLAWSRSPAEIKDRVNALVAGGNTSTDVGVKWGNALLDPGSRDVLHSLADDGLVDESLRGRPYQFNSGDAMKVMVVMSDGVHTQQYYMKDAYRGDLLTNVWASFNGNGDVIKFSIWSGDGPEPQESNNWYVPNDEFYWPHAGQWKDRPHNHTHAVRLTYQQLWAHVTVRHHAYDHVEPVWGAAARDEILNSYTYVQPSAKNDNLIEGCDAAKDRGVVVFSVGLEVTPASGQLLEDCATSPNHYFLVNGQDLSYAFKSIAGQINQLRLTQ